MNCANHPERTATAFCQNCGKALCPECTRTVNGLLLCEPCLAARTAGVPGASAGWAPVAPQAAYPASPTRAPLPQAIPQGGPSPVLAGLLGFIPGVGAMYNGQFVKGMIHVVVFIVLVGMTNHMGPVGLLVAAWEFYQVFDAAQTAAARRDGRPLPDPFGLLDLSGRLGPAQPGFPPGTAQAQPVRPQTYQPPAAGVSAAGAAQWAPVPPQPAAGAQGPAPYTTVPNYPVAPAPRRGTPFGAVLLIVLGTLFLLNTLDVLNFDWIGRGWPLLILLAGVWMLVRRQHRWTGYPPTGTPVQPAPPPAAPGTTLSISPYPGTSQTHEGTADEREER